MKLEIKNINKGLLISIVICLLVVIVGTYAWLTWRSKETDLKLTVGNIDDTMVTISPYKIDASILPALSFEEEEYANVEAINNSPEDKTVEVYYVISEIATELVNENFKYTITKSTDGGTTYTEYKSGDFSSAVVDEELVLFTEDIPANTTYKYRIYTWLYGEDANSESIIGKTFVGELNVRISNIILTGAQMLIANANPTTLMYDDATDTQKANMWTFNQAATEQVPATTDYRFIGNSPNNWIIFNGDEEWRIIGVFDNKIKIIKNDSIGKYSFDYKKNGVGSSTTDYGSSDWTDSQLMYMLNTPFYKTGNNYNTTLLTQELLTVTMGDNTVRTYSLDGNFIKDNNETPNIIYELGKIPAETAASATSYSGSATAWELNETAKNQIAKTTFYLGGTSSSEQSATAWYNQERGITTPNSNKNPISWTGYVGLMYPSDYAYTYAYGVDDNCFSSTSRSNCPASVGEKSWLWNDVIKSSKTPWTISSFQDAVEVVYDVDDYYANVGYNLVRGTVGVLPSIYLESEIELSGTGSYGDPYRIIE